MSLAINNPTDYQVGLYIRLSKEDETEGPSESVSNQLSMLERFASEQQLHIYDRYIDDGWSGTNFDRPAFQRMLLDMEAGKVNMVITKDLSRLGRDYILTGHYMERYFPEHCVRYLSLLDGIDTGVESTANDITPFRAIMNDMYAKDISKKIKSVKHDKQRKGLFIGGKPVYGYQMHPCEKNRIVVDEAAASTVRRIFHMALEGESCRQIATRLNAERIPTPATYAGLSMTKQGPYAGLWSSERISDLLQNETYIGNMVQGRSKKVSYKSQKCRKIERDKWIVVEGTHEPIIRPEEFRQVSLLLEKRRHTRSRTYDFMLKGLIHCHECGYPLAVINRRKANGEDCLYFVCRTYQRFSKSGVCSCHSIQEKTVSKVVLEQLQAILDQSVSFAAMRTIAEEVVGDFEEKRQGKQEIHALCGRISQLSTQLDKVYMDQLSGTLEMVDFSRIYDKIKDERSLLEETLARKRLQAEELFDRKAVADQLTKQFLSTAGQNRELLVSLIERIEYSEDRQLYLYFRFRQGAISYQP